MLDITRVSWLVRLLKANQRSWIIAALGLGLLPSLQPGIAAERTSSIVQDALRSEINLDADERSRLLDEALQQDPRSPEVHWARGEVNVQGFWLTLESAAFDSIDRADLKQYRERRYQADETIDDQIRMARYCRAHHLSAQERAHWTAVLARAPNHIEARQRLGQVNIDGIWIDERQLEKQKKNERATSDFLSKHGKELVRLSNALFEKSRPREQIVKKLAEFKSPLVIPGLESLLSNRGEAGGLCTVETLSSMPAPEASSSLVRHAMLYPFESVRDAATNSLKQRDEHSYIPTLLAALRKPVQKHDEFTMTSSNTLIWRQSIFAETQDSKRIATLDRVIPLDGISTNSLNATANLARQTLLAAEMQIEQLNVTIESTNEQVMELLEKTTEVPSPSQTLPRTTRPKKTPDEWWNWWNDRIESYPADSKEVQVRYETVLVTPVIPEFRARHECLAAGTPIWTETGAVDVESIKAGDMVLTQNSRSGELKFAPVLATSIRPPEKLLCLKFGGETVRATGGHPFWVSGKGWIKARSLQAGMGLHTVRGVVKLDSVEDEFEPCETYNLIVDECHSYFVGKNLILSHDNTSREPVATQVPGLRFEAALARIE